MQLCCSREDKTRWNVWTKRNGLICSSTLSLSLSFLCFRKWFVSRGFYISCVLSIKREVKCRQNQETSHQIMPDKHNIYSDHCCSRCLLLGLNVHFIVFIQCCRFVLYDFHFTVQYWGTQGSLYGWQLKVQSCHVLGTRYVFIYVLGLGAITFIFRSPDMPCKEESYRNNNKKRNI